MSYHSEGAIAFQMTLPLRVSVVELWRQPSIHMNADQMGQFHNAIIQICISYVVFCAVLCEQDSAKQKCIFDQNYQ